MLEIRYGGSNPFEDLSPTPLVSRTDNAIRAGNRWSYLEEITLDGVITGNCEGFSGMLSKTQALETRFASGFQTLQIYDTDAAGAIYSAPYSIVKSISYSDSVYSQTVPYTVTLDSYPEALSSGYYGVLDPVRSVSFSEESDNRVTVTNEISARGFNTDGSSGNALSNAVSFVNSYTGSGFLVYPLAAPSPSGLNQIILSDVKEAIDRNAASYSVTETYVYDPSGTAPSGVLNYTVDIGDAEPYKEISLNGTIDGGVVYTGHQLRDSYNALNIRSMALSAYSGFYSGEISLYPESVSVSEDGTSNRLEFSCVFSNAPTGDPYVVESYTVSRNEENGISCLNYNANFVSRNSSCSGEWAALSGFYTGYDFYSQATGKWETYSGSGQLNPDPRQRSLTVDRNAGAIRSSYTFCNESGSLLGECTKDFNYSLNFAVPVTIRKEHLLLHGGDGVDIQSLGTKRRASFGIRGSASTVSGCSEKQSLYEVRQKLEQINTTYSPNSTHMLNQSITTGEGGVISFDVSWSANRDFDLPVGIEPGGGASAVKTGLDFWNVDADGNLFPHGDNATSGTWAYSGTVDTFYLTPKLAYSSDEDWEMSSLNLRPF